MLRNSAISLARKSLFFSFLFAIVNAQPFKLNDVQTLLGGENIEGAYLRGFVGHCSNALITIDGVEHIDEKHIRLSPRFGKIVIESHQLTTHLILGDSPYISDYVRLTCDLSNRRGRLLLWTTCDGNSTHCNQGYNQFQIDLETHAITALASEEAGPGGQK